MNIIVKASDAEPGHATIAGFISSNNTGFTKVFTEVVLKCAELDLIGGDMFAIDGCKLPSNASKECSGTLSDLRKKKADLEKLGNKLIQQHKERDKHEKKIKKLNKTCRGFIEDKRYHKHHMERIEKKLRRINAFLETAEPRTGSGGEEVQSNITDNESAKIKGPHGYIQGYNGIAAADCANQVIVTADTGYFSEANSADAAERKIGVIIPDPQFRNRDPGHEKKEERYKAEDFKYNKKENIYKCPVGKVLIHKGHVKLNRNSGEKYQAKSKDCKGCAHRERCIRSRGGKGNAARTLYIADKGQEKTYSEKMREKPDDPVYRELYGRRMQIIKPVFADITRNKKLDRFLYYFFYIFSGCI
jgi:hypothetical protein